MPQVPVNPRALMSKDKSMFGTVEINPKEFRFETQNRNEKVFIKARAHLFTNVGWVFNSALLAVAPWVLLYILMILPFNFEIRDYISDYMIFVLLYSYYLVLLTSIFFNIVDWYFDVYLVTNHRVVKIQFDPLKKHRVSETRLDRIEKITESVVGFLPGLFDYGDVIVQTAAERGVFRFKSVPAPSWFRDVIMDLARMLKRRPR